MEEMTLGEKFGVLFSNILKHPLFIVFFFVPIILFFLKKKHGKKVYIIVYFISIISILFIFGDVLFKMFDNLMDGIFMTLYFPNFITLFIVVLLCALMGLISLFSTNMHKINKIINYIGFLIIYSLFALVLVTIQTNKINIYKDNALYSNSDVLALMQILIGAFAIQVISILVINIINKVTLMLDRKENINSIDNQIINLQNSKIKTINMDNDKIGYINVADKAKTSKPLLKPFRFNLEKLKSIKLDVTEPSKILTPIILKNKEVSYLNEITKVDILDKNSEEIVESLFEKEKPKIRINEIDNDKNVYLEVNEPIKPVNIAIENVSYFNEIIKPKKLKITKINSLKKAYINTNKSYRMNNLKDYQAHYLNEVVPKIKPIYLDFENIKVELKTNIINRLFNIIELKDKDVSYLREVIKPKKLHLIDLDSKKIKSIKFSKNISNKVYNIITLDNSKFIYELPKLGESLNTYELDENLKPDLMRPMKEEQLDLIDNLIIVDIQSTLDIVVNYHLMKNVKLKGYKDLITVNNLNVCNFGLLSKIIKKYEIIKKG